MASREPREGEEATKLGDCWDRRVYIEDPRQNDSKPPHLVHRTILPVLAACHNVKCKSRNIFYLGTCFVLDPLYDIFGESESWIAQYHYFATAGHNLTCRRCKSYLAVEIAIEWQRNSNLPSKYLVDGPRAHITQSGGPGWVRVSEIDFQPNRDRDSRSRYQYDFGVTAVYADGCDPATSKIIEEIDAQQRLFMRADSSCSRSLADLCGYPHQVESEYGQVHSGQARTSRPERPRTETVAGSMFWMPLHPQVSVEDTEWSDEHPPDIDSNQEVRSKHQRSTAAVYSFPQGHSNESSEEYQTTTPELKSKLYRYYIDSTQGQSGSPVYLARVIGGKTKYCVVRIHVSVWELPDGKSCNVCMRLDAALDQMKAERWPEWARGQGSKADEESAALGFQGELL